MWEQNFRIHHLVARFQLRERSRESLKGFEQMGGKIAVEPVLDIGVVGFGQSRAGFYVGTNGFYAIFNEIPHQKSQYACNGMQPGKWKKADHANHQPEKKVNKVICSFMHGQRATGRDEASVDRFRVQNYPLFAISLMNMCELQIAIINYSFTFAFDFD
jgi:hypothetical protein